MKILLCLGFITIVGVMPVWAQSETSTDIISSIPEVKLTPDMPLYFLKSWREQLALSVKREINAQVDYRRQLAEARLAEAIVMVSRKREDLAIRLLSAYSDQVKVIDGKLGSSGLSADTVEEQKVKLKESQKTYQEVVQSLSSAKTSKLVEVAEPPRKEVREETSRFDFIRVLGVSTIRSSEYEPPFLTPVPLNR